jgi:transcriptional regulator with XRE-family HTH domain
METITSEVMESGCCTREDGAVSIIRSRETQVGPLLRHWRELRRLSQLAVASEAEVSARHVSFIESGRSQPSRSMVLRLSNALDIPHRAQNQLLVAAGFAPIFSETSLEDAAMADIRRGIEQLMAAYEPYPCLVVDRHWNIVTMNAGVARLVEGVAPALLERPNALRISLHPDGMSPRIRNLPQWRRHVLDRLGREAAATGSDSLVELLTELTSYPGGIETGPSTSIVVPLELESPEGPMAFMSAVTTFGTAVDLTVSELSIEAFLPADAQTVKLFQP